CTCSYHSPSLSSSPSFPFPFHRPHNNMLRTLFQNVPRCAVSLAPRAHALTAVRRLSIHEHQSVGLLRQFGVNTLRGKVATSAEAAESAALNLKGNKWVVKSQVLAGGRGKGTFKLSGMRGGVQLADSPA